MDALCRGAGILKINVLRGDLNIVQSGLDVSVSHQLHESGKANPSAHHVRGESVPKSVRIGLLDAGDTAMMAKQGTQTGPSHTVAARRSF
jgi:hypothetical protein